MSDNFSVADRVARLPAVEREEFYSELTEADAAGLDYDWQFWGRPNQFEPVHPTLGAGWGSWLILAGRGFGKTRTGAETVRNRMCGSTPLSAGRWRHVALIAETAADARDVMVADGKEGSESSGILPVHPPDFRPLYEPSKRRLTWPNGATGTIFNATEPDQLRGPQFDGAWCFPAGTLVAMADGEQRPIERVRIGEFVLTRRGARQVLSAAMTNNDAELWEVFTADQKVFDVTGDHPVYIDGRGFIAVKNLKVGDQLWTFSAKAETFFSSQVELITATKPSISESTITIRTIAENCCIGVFTRIIKAQFRRAMSSTMRTKLAATILRGTSTACRGGRTNGTTQQEGFIPSPRRRLLPNLTVTGLCRLPRLPVVAVVSCFVRAALATFGSSARPNAWRYIGPTPSKAKLENARFAERVTPQPSESKSIAAENATTLHLSSELNSNQNQSHARIAPNNSPSSEVILDSAKQNAPSLSTVAISAVSKSAKRAPVFDIAVDGEHEFFANGVLVHNCDELCKWRYAKDTWDNLQFGLRTGDAPQVLITTTPKPILLLKEIITDPLTVMTQGSTLDNRANLAPRFLATILRKYEGTRLGRQEINAEILEDVQGAMWRRPVIDALRVRLADLPPLKRIVVAIDPATSSNDDSNETGIIVAGLGEDGHAYVLDDVSGIFAPDEWAREAVSLYWSRRADRVIGESNNGGEMIENTLRVVDPNVSYRAVWASRGKVIRAEPISALYEQGRVHHVGAFAQLEDQMCAFTPDFDRKTAGYSPDRMDALVWALTELMIDGDTAKFHFV